MRHHADGLTANFSDLKKMAWAMIAQDTRWQMQNAAKKSTKNNTHQLVKRLLHVNAALGGRLKERHSKTLRKVTPLRVRHLTVVNEITLQNNASTRRKIQNHSAATLAHLVANNYNGHVVGILHAQNLISELRHLVKRRRTCNRVHDQEALRSAHVLIAHCAVLLLHKTQKHSARLMPTRTLNATRTHLPRCVQDVQ